MALSLIRREMRCLALTNAASMLDEWQSGGASPEESGLTDEEFEILIQENKKLASKLNAMAEKLMEGYSED